VRIDLPAMLSSAHSYLVAIPMAFVFSLTIYFGIIWVALSRKDEVEASAWHRDTGFYIRARGRRRKSGPFRR
jgi:hypothetical protein